MNIYFILSITFFAISILLSSYKSKHQYQAALNTLLIFLYLAITILYFSADYFTGEGITQVVLFTLKAGLNGAGFGEYLALIAVSASLFVFAFALSYLYWRLIKNDTHPKPKRLKSAIHNTFLFFAFLTHPFNLDLYSLYLAMHTTQSKDFDQHYKRPSLSMKRTNGYNLVYIYAESLERTYFDESIFPNLMNNLKAIKSESTEFTNIHQVARTRWTIGGMTASQCAIPLFTSSKGNSMRGVDSFLSGASCLGDVLKSLDYHLVFMQGSSIDFSGLREFYSTHEFDEIYGVDDLKNELADKNYMNGWGLYDDSLLAMAYGKFEQLSKDSKPFALFIATIDTHHPNGMTSKSCRDIPYGDGENNILNAVHCSDRLISQFIEKIRNSKYANKTLIVLTSDHLAMKNTASDLLKKGTRRDLFLIFDPKNKKYISVDKAGSMFDVSPTVLHKLGVMTDLGLGRNLFQKESLCTVFDSSSDSFDKKLYSWKNSIWKFWNFATLGKSYEVNARTKKVYIDKHSYKYPTLIKIEEDNAITPFFEYDSTKKLIEYFQDFIPEQKFIWIDRCVKINRLFGLDLAGNYCIAQGSLSSKVETKVIHKGIATIDTSHLLDDNKHKNELYQKQLKKIPHILDCFNPPEGKVSIVSSSMPILNSIPSAIRAGLERWEDWHVTRGLNLLTRDHDGKYHIEQFDVFGSEEDAFDFLKTVALLIKKKNFWALMANNAISNTYPRYRERLDELGLELLATLNFRVAYIAYQDKDGKIHEFSDKDTICKIIPSFVKPISDKERKIIEEAKAASHKKATRYADDPNRFIAHAGGAIDGDIYTNSLEALDASYAKGFKLFELDIIETSDDAFVAGHDWHSWKRNTGFQGQIPPTLKAFKGYKIMNKYTPLDINDINNWFKEHSDAILVTDKINKPLKFSEKFIDKNRLMMELFTWDAVKEGLRIGIKSSMPTGSLLYSIEGNRADYLEELGITDIACSRRMIYHKAMLEKIINKGIHLYAFHVNFDKGKDEKYVLCEENKYFYGMYADNWNFKRGRLLCP